MKKKELKELLKQQREKIIELNDEIKMLQNHVLLAQESAMKSINLSEEAKKQIILHKEVIQKKIKQIECVEGSNSELHDYIHTLKCKITELEKGF
jgi:translation initiation factor 6 (eIF-6)